MKHSAASFAFVFWIFVLAAGVGCGRKPGFAGKSVAELTVLLGSVTAKDRADAAMGLGKLGREAALATPALAAALKDGDRQVRQLAADALGRIGAPEAASAVPALADALGDEDAAVRRMAAVSLGKLGPAAAAAIPALKKTAKDKAPIVQSAAEAALKKITAN
ncbi:MAG: HEAT repeat domain-containing protein [Planctomycetia bacterium]